MYENLVKEAFEAMKSAYAPYSNYHVGACVLCKDGRTFRGVNIENASYGATNCAERSAVFAAYSYGYRKNEIEAIAIVSDGARIGTPCGICRQVLEEFCDSDGFEVILARPGEVKTWLLKELLPLAFSGDNLETTDEKTGEV